MEIPWFLNPHLLSFAKECKKAQAKGHAKQTAASLSSQDLETIERIQHQTRDWNSDNISRTRAYLSFYQKRPEVHWALLAHLVSRNAGWNMTDLRGEYLPRLLSVQEQTDYYSFLERGNWLIFQDAYPQLLLYEESVKRQTNLFHLLPRLHVSSFMQGAWNHFWKTGDRQHLTISLIINEQHYLEEQVMRDQKYLRTVIQTLPFALQELLQLGHILFPSPTEDLSGGALTLYGNNVSHFASLSERIALGKKLYALLFRDSARLEGILAWAVNQPHSGSRKDYWPHLFHDVDESVPGQPTVKKLSNCRLRAGAKRLYSPILRHAWEPEVHAPPTHQDWYRGDLSVLRMFVQSENHVRDEEIGEVYCKALETIELAVIARGKIFPSNPRFPRRKPHQLLAKPSVRGLTPEDVKNP